MLNHKNGRVASALTAALLTSIALGACSTGGAEAPEGSEESFTVGYAGLSDQFPFVADVNAGLKAASEAAGFDLIVLDNKLDPQVALQNADTLIQRNADVIIEFQTDSSIAGALCEKFESAGLGDKVIAIDIPHPPCAIFFGVDNAEAGRLAGQKLAEQALERWGKLDKLVLLELPQSGELVLSRTNEYVTGIREVFPDFSEDDVVRLDGKNTLEDSRTAIQNVMASLAEDEAIGVGTVNDASAVGALRAIQAAGREDSFLIASQTGTAEGRLEICGGSEVLFGSVGYFPENYGAQLIELVKKLKAGEEVGPDQYIQIDWINAENIRDFYPDC